MCMLLTRNNPIIGTNNLIWSLLEGGWSESRKSLLLNNIIDSDTITMYMEYILISPIQLTAIFW